MAKYYFNLESKSFGIYSNFEPKGLSEDWMEISERQYNAIQAKLDEGCNFEYKNGKFVYTNPVVDPKIAYQQEMNDILAWLNANDYIINKHVLGEYADDDTRWTNYLADRKTKLERYNELENLLNN